MNDPIAAGAIILLFIVAVAPYFALLNLRHLDGTESELKRIADTLERIADELHRMNKDGE